MPAAAVAVASDNAHADMQPNSSPSKVFFNFAHSVGCTFHTYFNLTQASSRVCSSHLCCQLSLSHSIPFGRRKNCSSDSVIQRPKRQRRRRQRQWLLASPTPHIEMCPPFQCTTANSNLRTLALLVSKCQLLQRPLAAPTLHLQVCPPM